jgi:SOS-response transcriptional repressor LexA
MDMRDNYDICNFSASRKLQPSYEIVSRSPCHSYAMRNAWLKSRLKELRPKGKSVNGLAKTLRIPAPRISEIIAGSRQVQSTEVARMAAYLEWPESVLLAHIDPNARAAPQRVGSPLGLPTLRLVKVIGAVQAGDWREAIEWPDDEQSYVYANVDPYFVGMTIFALQVRGSSMNRLYPEGTVLICASTVELPQGFVFESGDKVIVRRRDRSGLYEATVKEYVVQPDGTVFLWPRSDDPNHQQPWALPNGAEPHDESDDLRIIGLVINSTRTEISAARLRIGRG